jgi:hypothetical protein
VHKSLTSLAGAATFILLLGVPVVTVAAQSEAPVPGESKEAIIDRTAVDEFAAAQARLAFSLIEKITNGNNAAAPCAEGRDHHAAQHREQRECRNEGNVRVPAARPGVLGIDVEDRLGASERRHGRMRNERPH